MGMNCDMDAGKEKSFRLVFPSVDTPGTAVLPTPNLVSNCWDVSPGTASAATTVRVPDVGTLMQVQGFSGAGCTGDMRVYDFFQGLKGMNLASDGLAKWDASQHQVFLDSQWCSGAALSATPFASGAWNNTGRNIVCTVAQLRNLSFCNNGSGFNDNHLASN